MIPPPPRFKLTYPLLPDPTLFRSPVGGAGGAGESVIQPVVRNDGELHFLSDRDTGWWNAYGVTAGGDIESRTRLEAEIGTPQWVFGMSRYGFLADGRMVFAYAREGLDHLDRKSTRLNSSH